MLGQPSSAKSGKTANRKGAPFTHCAPARADGASDRNAIRPVAQNANGSFERAPVRVNSARVAAQLVAFTRIRQQPLDGLVPLADAIPDKAHGVVLVPDRFRKGTAG